MKYRAHKFDQFIVWVFSLDKGETKDFMIHEVVRTLPHNDTVRRDAAKEGVPLEHVYTMNPITLITKGSLKSRKAGFEDRTYHEGQGGWSFVAAHSLDGYRFEALQDDTEYHCILPRDHQARFWERTYEVLKPGTKTFPTNHGPSFIYVARGSLNSLGSKKFIEIPSGVEPTFRVDEETMAARIWIDERTGI